MKKIMGLLLLLAISFKPFAQQPAQVSPLTIGETHIIPSTLLKEDRRLNIFLPDSFNKAKPYPVIYVLDGSMHEDFLHITGLVQFFNLQFNMPQAIIVGISNVDRKRDFTFHTDKKDLQKDYPTTGHSEPFIGFIENELQPYIRNTFRTNDTSYIIGQSLGALLATEILLHHPQLFTHYFIISPSLWWDDESLLEKAPALLAAHTARPDFVYVSVGAGEHKIMQRDAKALYDLLTKNYAGKVRLSFNLMAKENHATILHNSLYEGLQVLFPYKEN